LPVKGKPLIVHQLLALAAIGIHDIVINIAYLAEKFQEILGNGTAYGVNIQYAIEPVALETGGGIYNALPLLGPTPFLAISGDIWTDYPFATLPAKLTQLAHLVLVDNPAYHPKGDFVLRNGILQEGDSARLTFANIGIYHPDLFKACQPGIFGLASVLHSAMRNSMITGEHYQGEWHNVGTIEEWRKLENLAETI
jgi:MurNAc alpha-1-phosphate uridylyltransferase